MEIIKRKEQGNRWVPQNFFIFDPNPGLAARAELRDENLGISGVRPILARLNTKNRLRKTGTFDSENRKLESKIGPKTDQKVITQQLGIPSTVGIGKLVSKYTGGSHGGYNEGNCKVGSWGLKPPSFSENFFDFFAYTGHY